MFLEFGWIFLKKCTPGFYIISRVFILFQEHIDIIRSLD